MPTFFFRQTEHKAAPTLEFSRLVSALLHLSIPVVTYHVLYNGWGTEYMSQFMTIHELAAERKQLYMVLDVYYSIRWAMGMLTMMSQVTLPSGTFVACKHFLCDEMGYIVFGGIASSKALALRDYFAATLMVVAGILQHGSELQRWWFKRDASNVGKLHTSGLFGCARGINHTGHILRDVAHMILAPNPYLMLLYLCADYDLAFQIVPETVKHMRKKYGLQYEKYEKQTPCLFFPGVC